MFTQFFGLKFNPFGKEIDFDQLFMSQDLKEFEFRLKYLQQIRGIGLIAGEPGCGKTTALRKYVHELNPASCYFALSTVTVLEFYQGLALPVVRNNDKLMRMWFIRLSRNWKFSPLEDA